MIVNAGKVILSLLGAIALFATNSSSGFGSDLPDWAIYVYMNGDNNLETDALKNLNTIEAAHTNEKIKWVVEISRSAQWDTTDGNWSGTRRYEVVHDTDSTKLASLPLDWQHCESGDCELANTHMVDLGVAQNFADFLDWAVQKYPAKRKMVILWGHGQGWKSEIDSNLTKGLLPSSSSGRRITTVELGSVLDSYSKTHGTIDVLGFDACSMQMLEVLDQISGTAHFVLGSEHEIPPDGFNYTELVREIEDKSDDTVINIFNPIIAAYAEQYRDQFSTLSIVDMAKIPDLLGAINSLSTELKTYQTNGGDTVIQTSFNETVKFVPGEFTDLGSFLQRLKSKATTPIADRAGVALLALNDAVRRSMSTGFAPVNGISIYFPLAHMYDPSYKNLRFASDTTWADFLSVYFQSHPTNLVVRLLTLSVSPPDLLGISPERASKEIQSITDLIIAQAKDNEAIRGQLMAARSFQNLLPPGTCSMAEMICRN